MIVNRLNADNNIMEKTILIVEDDAGLAELAAEKVAEIGYETFIFNHPQQALAWLKKNTPFMMLLDYSLPEMNASEFIREMVRNRVDAPPFIVTTGRGDERIAVEMMKLGARDYIVKDVNYLDMLGPVVARIAKEIYNERRLAEAESELKNLSIFNEKIIEVAQEGIAVYDTEMRYLKWNRFMEELTGLSSDEVLGKQFLEVFPMLKETEIHINILEALKGHVTEKKEFYFQLTETGKSGWINDVAAPIMNARNEVVGAISTIHDITKSKMAEVEVRRISLHYQAIIEKAPDGFVLLNSDGIIQYISPSGRKMFGYYNTDPADIIPNQLTHPDDLPMVLFHLERLQREPDYIPTIEYRFAHADGHWVWVESTMSNLLSDPNVQSILINFRDITDRKKTEEELKESEEKFRTITEQSDDFIGIADMKGIIRYASPAVLELFGYTAEEMIGKDFIYFVADELRDTAKVSFRSALANHRSMRNKEYKLQRKDGSLFYGEVSASVYEQNGFQGMLAIIHDIDNQKKIQADLMEYSRKLKQLLDSGNSFLQMTNQTVDYKKILDQIVSISGAKYASFNMFDQSGKDFYTVAVSGVPEHLMKLNNILGFDLSEKKWKHDPVRAERIKDRTITEFRSFGDIAKTALPLPLIKLVENSFGIGKLYVVKVLTHQRAIGDITLLYSKGESIRNEEMAELFVNQVALFIQRNDFERELAESEKKFRVLFAENPQPMIIYNVDTLRILGVNHTAEIHYGYSENEFLQMTITQLHPEEDTTQFLEMIRKVRKGIPSDEVVRHRIKSGELIDVELHSTPAPLMGKNARLVLLNDVTEKKQAENQIKSSNSLLNATLESTAEGILAVDPEGKTTIYNRKFVEMWNIPDEILSSRLDEQLLRFVASKIKDFDTFMSKVSYLYKHPGDTNIDMIELLDGRVFERYSIPQVIGENIVGRLWSFRDITESLHAGKLLRESENRYRMFINTTPDLVFIKDENLRHLVVNKALCQFYEKSEAELLGKTDEQLFGRMEYATEWTRTDLEAIRLNDIIISVEELGTRTFETIKFPVEYESGKTGVGGYIRDITARRLAETELQEKMNELLIFQKVTVGRELTMIEMKKEVNNLLIQLGKDKKYKIID